MSAVSSGSYSYSTAGSGSETDTSHEDDRTYDSEETEETEDDSEYSESGEESEEKEPEEDRLKYRTFPIRGLPSNQSVTVMLVREKFIYVATDQGMVIVLDSLGEFVCSFAHHLNPIRGLSADAHEDFIAAVCVGGLVTIQKLYPDSKDDFYSKQFDSPLNCVALHPEYRSRDDKPFLVGGYDYCVTLVQRTWPFGNRSTTQLTKKEGRIHALTWKSNFAAWANDASICICDMDAKTVFYRFPRPDTAPRPDMFRCCLFWENDRTLLVGWGNFVRVFSITSLGIEDRLKSNRMNTSKAEVTGGFETDRSAQEDSYFICGLAPLTSTELFILSCTVQHGVHVAQLQARIVDRHHGGAVSLQQLRIKANTISLSYGLEHTPSSSISSTETEVYFISSPDVVIVAEPCNDDDKVAFLLEHKKYADAFEVGKTRTLKTYGVQQLGIFLLNDLVAHQQYERAASYFRQVLGETDEAAPKWRDWINLFVHHGRTALLARYLPYVEDMKLNGPRLQREMYEVVLGCCIDASVALFKEHVVKFKGLYDPLTVCNAARDRYRKMRVEKPREHKERHEANVVLLGESLGVLYEYQNNYSEALTILLEVKGGEELFEFIDRHKLFPKALELLDVLFRKNEARTIALLLRHRQAEDAEEMDPLCPENVVRRLETSHRPQLWTYLRALKVASEATFQATARKFAQLFTMIYADYDRKGLLPFLKSIHTSLNLRTTFEICKQRDLVEERVYIMARMGYRDEGLSVILKEMRNVEMAIDYIRELTDDEQRELYPRLVDLIFSLEEKEETFRHPLSPDGQTLSDIMKRYGVTRKQIEVSQVRRVRVGEEIHNLTLEARDSDLVSFALATGTTEDQVVLMDSAVVLVRPRMLSRLLTAMADPNVGETNAIDATKLIRRISAMHKDIPNLGASLGAITVSKGAHRALMQTLLRVLDYDVANLHNGLGIRRRKAVKVNPAFDRSCRICSGVIDRDSMIIFSCYHAYHSTCLRDELVRDETLKGCWKETPPNGEQLFLAPDQYILEKGARPSGRRQPVVCCRECPQIESEEGVW